MAESEATIAVPEEQNATINLNNSCRLCLSKEDVFSIFKSDKLYENDTNLCTIISQCVAVKVSKFLYLFILCNRK